MELHEITGELPPRKTLTGAELVSILALDSGNRGGQTNFTATLAQIAALAGISLNGVAGSFTIGGLLYESVGDNITAAGTTQGTATQLVKEITRITAGTGGVVLPPNSAGLGILIINHTGVPIQVYGAGSDLIDDIAGATGVAQMNGSLCLFASAANGNWYSNGIGTGYAGAFPTVSYTNGITATAAGTQTTSVLLTTALNRVITVVTAGDGVKLPLAVAGMQVTVFNSHASNPLNVWPGVGDAINALAANAVYSMPPGKTATFFTTVGGFWHALLSA